MEVQIKININKKKIKYVLNKHQLNFLTLVCLE